MEDELFREAVSAVREECRRDFERSKIEDDRGRLIARLKVDLLEDILTKLAKHIRWGVRAADDLSMWERFKERMTKRRAA